MYKGLTAYFTIKEKRQNSIPYKYQKVLTHLKNDGKFKNKQLKTSLELDIVW